LALLLLLLLKQSIQGQGQVRLLMWRRWKLQLLLQGNDGDDLKWLMKMKAGEGADEIENQAMMRALDDHLKLEEAECDNVAGSKCQRLKICHLRLTYLSETHSRIRLEPVCLLFYL
jgi:hypothetical protein